ncbi:Uncharacterized protein HZ326_21294 [Fusarium oxysporum f. sp. albedinis]|nr:Uncharacterized protein HZ326_21294 [Fusarium oxysporum f. sp. albedinis]
MVERPIPDSSYRINNLRGAQSGGPYPAFRNQVRRTWSGRNSGRRVNRISSDHEAANPGLYYEGSPLLHAPPVDEERHGFIRRLFDGASTPGKDSYNRLIKWPANTFHITKVTLMSSKHVPVG